MKRPTNLPTLPPFPPYTTLDRIWCYAAAAMRGYRWLPPDPPRKQWWIVCDTPDPRVDDVISGPYTSAKAAWAEAAWWDRVVWSDGRQFVAFNDNKVMNIMDVYRH